MECIVCAMCFKNFISKSFEVKVCEKNTVVYSSKKLKLFFLSYRLVYLSA